MGIQGISSMATRRVLAELAGAWRDRGGGAVAFESVGGVEAARRVAAGEAFDLVVLDAEALERLAAQGHVRADSVQELIRSRVTVAVRSDRPHPDISTPHALQDALLAASAIGYSTGPSGRALLELFEQWGIREVLAARLIQATPGVPVARLIADGRVAIGFQQMSEMLGVDGIDILGGLPAECAIVSTFAAAVGSRASQPQAAREFIAFLQSAEADAIKRRHGMEPARAQPESIPAAPAPLATLSKEAKP